MKISEKMLKNIATLDRFKNIYMRFKSLYTKMHGSDAIPKADSGYTFHPIYTFWNLTLAFVKKEILYCSFIHRLF